MGRLPFVSYVQCIFGRWALSTVQIHHQFNQPGANDESDTADGRYPISLVRTGHRQDGIINNGESQRISCGWEAV